MLRYTSPARRIKHILYQWHIFVHRGVPRQALLTDGPAFCRKFLHDVAPLQRIVHATHALDHDGRSSCEGRQRSRDRRVATGRMALSALHAQLAGARRWFATISTATP